LYNTQVFSIKSEAQINPNLFSHKNFWVFTYNSECWNLPFYILSKFIAQM
jgi:hypothetical protein